MEAGGWKRLFADLGTSCTEATSAEAVTPVTAWFAFELLNTCVMLRFMAVILSARLRLGQPQDAWS